MFLGHDSRFVIEQNIGWSTTGDQTTSWLFQETKQLHDLGAKVTYSGDQPFLLKLFLGLTKDDRDCFPSKAPMYFGSSDQVKSTTVHEKTKRRLDIELPFRNDLPVQSLAFAEDMRCVCPDATHALIRCVEGDLKKMVDKIISRKKDKSVFSPLIERLEQNMTDREVKLPRFKFTFGKNNKCESPSLSGSEATTTIASREELSMCANIRCDLFDGVWSHSDLLEGCNDNNLKSVTVLRELHPKLFTRQYKSESNYISFLDLAELWRCSLHKMSVLLRNGNGLDVEEYKFWAETQYQVSLTLFPSDLAITPYKVKLMLIPQLLDAGYIKNPWDHMTEGLEKSNHNSNKSFQTKTMRGGGKLYHHDPMFLDMYFSFCNHIQKARNSGSKMQLIDNYVNSRGMQSNEPQLSYLEVCQDVVPPPKIAIDTKRQRNEFLLGLRFMVLGTFKTKNINNAKLEQWIRDLGGDVLQKAAAEILLKKHSQTPNCFVVVDNATDLEKMLQVESSVKTNHAETVRQFSAGNWRFVSWTFVRDSMEAEKTLDPENYCFNVRGNTNSIRVNDSRPLFKNQRLGHNSGCVSAISSVRQMRHKQITEATKKNGELSAGSDTCDDTCDDY